MSPEQFVVRSPQNDAEILAWGMFSGERGFGHRPGAKDRFYKRYLADPTAHPSLVRAAFLPCGRIIGSARLFVRDILLPMSGKEALKNEEGGDLYKALSSEEHGFQVIRSFGWGEVCSDPDWRGRGVAASVLNDVTRLMENLCLESKAPEFSNVFGFDETNAAPLGETKPLITLLQAADSVQKLYEKYGFQRLEIPYSRLPLTSLGTPDTITAPAPMSVVELFDEEFTLRPVDLGADVPSLMRLHDAFIPMTRCYGPAHRDEEYWSRWMKNVNSGSRMWVLETTPADANETSNILAYCMVQCKGGVFKVIDMAWDAAELHARAHAIHSAHHDPTSPCYSTSTPGFAYHYLSPLVNAAALDAYFTTPNAPSLWSTEFLVSAPELVNAHTSQNEGVDPLLHSPEPAEVTASLSASSDTTAHPHPHPHPHPQPHTDRLPSVVTPLVVTRLLFEPFSNMSPHAGQAPTTPCAPGAAALPFGFDRPIYTPVADPELADNGWMVRPLEQAGKVAEDLVQALHTKAKAGEFLVFGADAF